MFLILIVCSTKPLLGHHALVRVVGFRMAGFMLSGSGIRVCVHVAVWESSNIGIYNQTPKKRTTTATDNCFKVGRLCV